MLIPFLPGRLRASELTAAFDITRTVYQSSDQLVNNTTTFQQSTDLSMQVEATSIYEFDALIMYDTNSTADFKHLWQGPNLSAFVMAKWSPPVGVTAVSTAIEADVIASNSFPSGGVASGVTMSCRPSGIINISVAGSVTIFFAQNTAHASNTILKRGSKVRLTKVWAG